MSRYLLQIIASCFLSLLAFGCATTGKYEAMLNTWIGADEERLIDRWGPPSSVYVSGDSKYLTYGKSASGYMPGTAPAYQTTFVGNTAYTRQVGGSPGFAYQVNCTTTFTLRDGLIQSWRWEGNACKAK